MKDSLIHQAPYALMINSLPLSDELLFSGGSRAGKLSAFTDAAIATKNGIEAEGTLFRTKL